MARARPSIEPGESGKDRRSLHLPSPDAPRRWTFSFQYWKQIDHFGLGAVDAKWFASLLGKLAELSNEEVDRFRTDPGKRDTWRYHEIKWTQENIPVRRHDLDWIDPVYLENDAEYPLYQFQVSTSLGRVVGFWDEIDTFNVVLLDPLHNIQPSKRFDYSVSPTTPLKCHYTSVLFEIAKVQKKVCQDSNCEVARAVAELPGRLPTRNVIILQVHDDNLKDALAAVELGCADELGVIIAAGVNALLK